MHTPGPWAIGLETDLPDMDGRRSAQIIDAEGWHLATVALDPVEANARLIAAAPDLLAALIRARECIEDAVGESDGWQIFDEIDAAIAKATGEGARNA